MQRWVVDNGPRGTRQTLQRMAAIIRRSIGDAELRQYAGRIVRGLPQKDFRGEIEAVHAFVRDRIRYTLDPQGIELLQEPRYILQERVGDCDDKSILVCSLLGNLGHRTRLIAVGPSMRSFVHVFAQVRDRRVANERDPRAWINLECTEPWPVGFGVSWKGRMVENV